MDVYSASDGGVVQLDRSLAEYESLELLIADIATSTGLADAHVLLFLDDGRELRREVLEALWDRGGEGAGSSSNPRQTVYLFNRETFWTDAEVWAGQLREEVQFPPSLNSLAVSALSSLSAAQNPFMLAYDHLSHLQSLFLAQSRALEIAYSNLSHHFQPLIREFQAFAIRAERDLGVEERLIRGARGDMAMLGKVVVHEAFLKKKDGHKEKEKDRDRRESSLSSSGVAGDDKDKKEEKGKIKTLADFVHAKKMEQVRESCRVTHEEHVVRFNELAEQMNELAAHSERERLASEVRAGQVSLEFSESLARVEETLARVEGLLGGGPGDAAQDLMALDAAMRDDLAALTDVKNVYTLDVHIHLRQVADFQSRITEIVQPLTSLDSDLRSKTAFPHLQRLHHLPFAYVATVVEVVRRKQFSTFLLDWTARLDEVSGKFIGTERKRRQDLRDETLSSLPWSVVGLEESMAPAVHLSAGGDSETLAAMSITREDIEGLVKWVDTLKTDPEVLQSIEQGDPDPVEYLQTHLDALISSMHVSSAELDKMVDQEVLSVSKAGGRSDVDQLSVLEDLHAEYERRIADADQGHQVRNRQLADQHEQRTQSLQTRQAELQEELVRLRSDLGDEMLARQALSMDLNERVRSDEDKQRELEDQGELMTALQAEIAQERDRAKDLGVRLQEALLDVDGLRNAEHTLITQVQSMQDERSKSMQNMGEAHIVTRNLESQLAGTRAEMEATNRQLSQARNERDAALRSQSAEAERLRRDHIAETDGDRAVLEHQNLTLTKQLEGSKQELQEKLNAASNTSIRESNGLKAELSMTRAQLRDSQRREAILADELAMAKDTTSAMSQVKSHKSDVTRDAVALSSNYHDCCQRLLTAIFTSSTISGTASSMQPRSKTPPSAVSSNGNEMGESVLLRSLAQASAFDLAAFTEAVQRTINLVKKWSKSCKQYRDLARNRLTFTNFSKGDLALFLPTRNAPTRSWAAFNISAPHHFLQVTDAIRDHTSKEWIIARIVKTDEAVASGGNSIETNPFGLADGLRYHVHHVEVYDPNSIRPSRRSGSASFNGRSSTMDGGSLLLTSVYKRRGPSLDAATPLDPLPTETPGQEGPRGDYFPPMSVVESPTPDRDDSTPDPDISAEIPEGTAGQAALSPTSTVLPLPTDSPTLPPILPASSLSPPPQPAASPQQRLPSRTSSSGTPPASRPIFAPSSLVRPASVASSSSGNPKALPIPTRNKAAPAMGMTTSGSPSDHSKPSSSPSSIPELQRRVLRKSSSHSLTPPSDTLFRPPSNRLSPLSGTGTGDSTLKPSNGETNEVAGDVHPDKEAVRGFAALGTGSMKLVRGFSIRGRKASGLPVSEGKEGEDGSGKGTSTPTAMDMLRRFDGGA